MTAPASTCGTEMRSAMTLASEAVAAVRPMRKDAARNRELLIAAAREVFAQRGLEASLDDIAHHAGLGVGTAYRHFANKRELASALIDSAIDSIVELAEQSLTYDDAWLGLVRFLEGALAVQAEDRGLREVLMGLHDPEQLEAIHERLSAIIADLLERGRRQGVIRSDAVPSDVGFLMTMICAVADVGGDVAPDIWRRYLQMCLEGLKPGAAALAVAPLSEPDFRKAMATHKECMARPALKA
jgi:AcrR family transcriptional regulator